MGISILPPRVVADSSGSAWTVLPGVPSVEAIVITAHAEQAGCRSGYQHPHFPRAVSREIHPLPNRALVHTDSQSSHPTTLLIKQKVLEAGRLISSSFQGAQICLSVVT
jgi:hypothetical protein